MPSFDFISTLDFRKSLEADYAEMLVGAETESWKSVQVLAGSIIEALLIDYLVASNDPPRPGKEPLKLELAEAIALCQKESILTTRSADLSSVIRSYRNLIHPARIVRLGEEQPSRASGTIAVALVDLIIEEVAKRRQEKFGLTADQLLSKIERDNNCLPLLKHLLEEVSASHRERLLLELIPDRYFELVSADEDELFSDESMKRFRLGRAYRIIHDLASESERKKAAGAFVRILREADGDYVARFQEAFFAPEDIELVVLGHRAIVKEYFLTLVKGQHSVQTADVLSRITPFLQEADVNAWADPYISTITRSAVEEAQKLKIQRAFMNGFAGLPIALEDALMVRLSEWVERFRERNLGPELARAEELHKLVDGARFPF